MKFQPTDKGLFTFYREQAEFEDYIQINKKLKRNPKNIQPTKDQSPKDQPTKDQPTKDQPNKSSTNSENKPSSLKITPPFTQPLHLKKEIYNKKVGEEIVIINRKKTQEIQSTEQDDNSKRNRQSPMDGYFIENKSIGFEDMQGQYQLKIVHHQNKKSPFKLNFYNRYDSKEQLRRKIAKSNEKGNDKSNDKSNEKSNENVKLPLLTNKGQIVIAKRYQSKASQSMLKSKDSGLMQQIRESIVEESMQKMLREGVKRSVSFIQYSESSRLSNKTAREVTCLNAKQKRMLELLEKYKKVE